MKIPDIDKLADSLLPQQQEFSPTTKVLHQLELSVQGKITKQDLI